jgi:hypothetical protein
VKKVIAKSKTKYVSVKLPAAIASYPRDNYGNPKLPNYTKAYLKKHGRKLFKILFTQVPATVYSELIACLRENNEL